jgi:hypothetical protein
MIGTLADTLIVPDPWEEEITVDVSKSLSAHHIQEW